jgi:hypothetical protein
MLQNKGLVTDEAPAAQSQEVSVTDEVEEQPKKAKAKKA